MKKPEAYKGREQTYLKHFFLEGYLERVAYTIGWSHSDFVYIDGFSGPWRSEDEALEDTSFMIAIRQLRKVMSGIAEHGRDLKIRCIFVESNPRAFSDLKRAVEGIDDIEVTVLQGEFEQLLPRIVAEIGDSFALTFIDPTGWTGFPLDKITPLLRKRGEVIVNFMFDHIIRFRNDKRETTTRSLNELFGGSGWESAAESEEELLDFYASRLKERGDFKYATYTRILKPLSDRTYFYLVYATRHPMGLIKFREVEKRLLPKQEQVMAEARQTARIRKTGQGELFSGTDPEPASLQGRVDKNCRLAEELLVGLLERSSPLLFESAIPLMLEIPMVDKSMAKNIIRRLRDTGRLAIEGMKPRQRLPDDGCVLKKPG